LGQDAFRVEFKPETTPVSFEECQTVYVRMDDNTGFELSLENALLLQLTAEVMPCEELLCLPADIRAVAPEVSLEKILDQIDRHGGSRSSIREPAQSQEHGPVDRSLLLALTRQEDGYRSIARIRTDGGGMAWLAARLGRLPHRIDHRLDGLPFAGRVEAGRTVLSLAEIRGLSPFDIVLADGSFNRDLPDVFIRFSNRCVLAASVVHPRKILVQDIRPNEMESPGMTHDPKETPEQSGPSLEELPVELVFEIGAMRLTLAELKRIQPGYTLQPDVPINGSEPVTIRANGVAVGRGEIVQIEDRLGIRILALDNDITP
jgi:type III secretion protein Q